MHLLETTLIRVGNSDYAKQNRSYGLTTLRDPHVEVNGGELRFQFKGKSDKTWQLRVRNRRVAKIVKACQDLPGQDLFQYLDENGQQQAVTSSDVNAYLKRNHRTRDHREGFSHLGGHGACRDRAAPSSKASTARRRPRRNVREAIERVAARLGNTPTICRKCYVHPELLTCYLDGGVLAEVREAAQAELVDDLSGLRPEEAAVLTLLAARLDPDRAGRDARPRRPSPSSRGAPKARDREP